jgi:hypothetical protein
LASVEETASAVEALLPLAAESTSHRRAVERGLEWLVEAVESGRHRTAAPLAHFPNGTLYTEKLYPMVLAASALSQAVARLVTHERLTAAAR